MDYLLMFLLMLIIPISAQIYIKIVYNKNLQIKNSNGLSGFEVARKILDKNRLNDIHIVETKGMLADHYDPKRKVVRLSHDVFHGSTVASTSIAAHEVGHAIQDNEKYLFMKIRSFIFPIVNFSSKIAYIILLIGFITSIIDLVWIGIILVSFGIVFQIVTLPVEFNASKRAKKELESLALFSTEELKGVKNVLFAAALTYVAGLLVSLLELLRLIMIARDN